MLKCGRRIEAQLAQLEAKAAQRQESTKVSTGMAGVNKRNTGQNFVNAFKNVAAAVEGSRAAMAGADPFSRRQTQSRNYWTTRRNGAPRTADSASGSPTNVLCVNALSAPNFALLHPMNANAYQPPNNALCMGLACLSGTGSYAHEVDASRSR